MLARTVVALAVASAPIAAQQSTPTGLLLGYHTGAEYRTMLLVLSADTALVVADVPDLIVPRAQGFWRVGVETLCSHDGTHEVIWQAPIEATPTMRDTPCPLPRTELDPDSMVMIEPTPEDLERCEQNETAILFVSSSHIAERAHHRQTEYCEPRGNRHRDVSRVRLLGDTMPVSLTDLFGDTATAEYEAAIGRAYEIVSREMNCPAPGPEDDDMVSWEIGHERGAWRAFAANNRWGGCELIEPLALQLPPGVTGDATTDMFYHALSRITDLNDVYASPDGRHAIVLTSPYTPEQLELYVMNGSAPVRTLLVMPHPGWRWFRMVQWAYGPDVAEWTRVLESIRDRPLPRPVAEFPEP